jgi:hypothetical protein
MRRARKTNWTNYNEQTLLKNTFTCHHLYHMFKALDKNAKILFISGLDSAEEMKKSYLCCQMLL